MKKVFLVFIVFSFLVGTGCSKELTREKAKEKLMKNPDSITVFLGKKIYVQKYHHATNYGGVYKAAYSDYYNQEKKRLIEKMEAAGYVKTSYLISKATWSYGDWDDYYLTFQSTEKAKPFVISEDEGSLELMTARILPQKIDGITKMPMDENARVVEFTTIVEGNALVDFIPLSPEKTQAQVRHAIFRKYDDGWRLEGLSP